MNKKQQIEQRELAALVKYSAISYIESQRADGLSLVEALRGASLRPWPDRDGKQYSIRTLEDWWYTHAKGGFAALQSHRRSDRGGCRTMDAQTGKWLIEQIVAFPNIALKVRYEQWRREARLLPSLTTVYRYLRREGYDGAALRRGRLETGPTKAFEAPFSNDLWMVDFSPGPFLMEEGKALRSQLCLILDDHSRLIVFAAYYANADTRAFHDALKQAVQRRGVPHKLYTDQGKPFVSDHTRIVCANLGIRLLHAKPYHAWSKGKVERCFLTLQTGFESMLRLPGMGAGSLKELNGKLWLWIEEIYHGRVHSSTGLKPCERFIAGLQGAPARKLDPALDLERLFYARTTRTVRKDGTIRLDGVLYEVDLSLRGFTIELRFDPHKMDRVEVYHRQKPQGLARRVNLHLNSQLGGSRYYGR
ncbi:MAG: DDE-type integrase/transposase/recombinase [Candidatus Sulfotelmatobacter sp.]